MIHFADIIGQFTTNKQSFLLFEKKKSVSSEINMYKMVTTDIADTFTDLGIYYIDTDRKRNSVKVLHDQALKA